jgi:hypothetical protein
MNSTILRRHGYADEASLAMALLLLEARIFSREAKIEDANEKLDIELAAGRGRSIQAGHARFLIEDTAAELVDLQAQKAGIMAIVAEIDVACDEADRRELLRWISHARV